MLSIRTVIPSMILIFIASSLQTQAQTNIPGNVLVNGASQYLDDGNMLSILGNNNNTYKAGYIVTASGDAAVLGYFGSANASGVVGSFTGTFTNHKFAIRTNNTERIAVTETGHVGIGTTNPTSRLRIEWGAGSAYMLNSSSGLGDLWGFTGANGYNFTINSYAPAAGNLKTVLGVNFSINGSNGSESYVRSGLKKAPVILMDADNGSLSLYGESGSGGDYRTPTLNLGIAVASNGMVGVGAASPTEKLDVAGNIKTTGYMLIGATSLPAADAKLAVNGNIYSKKVKVTLTGWADYVFDAGYRLRPLSEVEQFIQQHHHLPEVPSAAEVEKKGLDLGDNQATLLKKIEELTLYIIQQQKAIEGLKEEIKAIKANK